MKTYKFNSEVGSMSVESESVEEAKELFAADDFYDFAGAEAGKYPGTWYWIDEDGVRVEDFTADMPQ